MTVNAVILDKKNYIEQAVSQLNDGIHYEQIAISHCTEIYNLIESKVKILHEQSHIDDISLRYLLDTKVEKIQVGRLYLLPKIHKIDLNIRNEIRNNKELLQRVQIPGRPIISLCNSPIERIGQFIDYFLQPIVRQLWTFTQDTTFFINKIERIEAPDDVILATFDISSMYTNLSHEEIIQAVYRAWPKLMAYNYAIPLPPRTEFLELLRITLENNEFEFNSVIYKQIVGVPMGALMSPSLTDLRIFEIISKILKEFTHAFKIIHLSVYRDDGFMLFAGNENELADFFEIANNIHPLIKFTHETSRTNVQFLDVTVYKGKRFITNKILDIKLYRKPTDNYQYLHRSSSHPSSVFKGFITGEIIRFIRSSNNVEDIEAQIQLFREKLQKRGYVADEIDPLITTTMKRTRESTLRYISRKKGKSPPLCFITKFNPRVKQLGKTLRKHWHLISNDGTANQLFKKPPIIAYQKPKLKRIFNIF
ncbi:uncharacterized protein LOC134694503 [Mytilus trossulus]|uniref:uncharacterized protein LOC134694503 n=1 Tax=Mytilus trossulus TaxID=6551 RepID=UPI003007CF7A